MPRIVIERSRQLAKQRKQTSGSFYVQCSKKDWVCLGFQMAQRLPKMIIIAILLFQMLIMIINQKHKDLKQLVWLETALMSFIKIQVQQKLQQTYQQQNLMSLDTDDIDGPYQRQDLHEFASQNQKNNFNIRRFADKQSNKHKKQSLRTKYTDFTKHRMNTEPVEDKFRQINSVMSYTNAFERIMNKNEPDRDKRMNLTGSLKHKNRKSFTISRNKNQSIIQDQIQTEKANKCRQLDKKHNKGPLRKKVIETWLNSILTQSTQFQVIDQTLGNAALKKFQIDQNSLLSRAIKPQNISRIYQSLFVHSIGFNNNIKQLVSNNNEVMKNIWKVFSVLLQYCAQGKFQTLIGVIQREKTMKVQELRQEVAKRQQIIQRNDQLNQNKNIQIFKEIKHLKQQNINLTNQKDILFEDYQKTQQAFNEQVALRLKFENKINELFGVHRELALKHQRLYDDYKKKIIQWNAANQKNAQLTQQNAQLKIQLNDLTSQRQRLLSSEKYNKQFISSLKEDKVKLNDEYNMVKHQYDEQRRISKQNKRRVTQLEIQIKNLSEIVGIKDKSWKETHSQYQLSLEQNNRLYNVINEQRVQVQSLLFEKKQFNNKILNLIADASFQKRKKQEFNRLYYDSDRKVKQLNDKVKSLELQNKILNKKNQSNEADLKINYENIQKMHNKNDQLQDELIYLRRFRDSLDSVLQQKDNQVQKFRQSNEKLNEENQILKTNLNKSELNYKLTKSQLDNQIENHKIKIQKLKEQKQLLQSGQNEKNRALVSIKLELQRTTKILQDTILSLKNQKFERVHLKANYDQLLVIMEKKNAQEKQMGRQISQLKDNVMIITQQKNKVSLALQNQSLRREKSQQQLQNIRNQYSAYMQKKSAHIHPLLFEDVTQNYRIIKAKHQEGQYVIKTKIEEIKQLHEKYNNQIDALNKSNAQYFNNFKKQKDKQIFQKQSLLEYEKQINQTMKKRLEKLQSLADTYAKKIEQRTSSQKQKIYAQLIEQKTKSIQQLVTKLNLQIKQTDQLKKEIIKKEQDHEHAMITVKRKNKQQQDKKDELLNQLNFEREFFQKQVKSLKQQIADYQTKFEDKLKDAMQSYMQNYRQQQQKFNQMIKSQNKSINQSQQPEAFKDTKIKWSMIDEIQKKNPAIKKRNDMSRKLKITYNYYKHE